MTIERLRILNKNRKKSIIFGSDKNSYRRVLNSSENFDEYIASSKETKLAADDVKHKLMSQHFKLGSAKPEYNSSSITGDKLVLAKDPKDDSDNKQR